MTTTQTTPPAGTAQPPMPAPITHAETGVPFSHRFCTDEACGKVVMLNKHGRCPKLVAMGAPTGNRPKFVPRVSPVQPTAPIVGVRGQRYDCDVEGHGTVTLNKNGACPRCATESLLAGWADHHAKTAAEKFEALFQAVCEFHDSDGQSGTDPTTLTDEQRAAITTRLDQPTDPTTDPSQASKVPGEGEAEASPSPNSDDDNALLSGQQLAGAVTDVFNGTPDKSDDPGDMDGDVILTPTADAPASTVTADNSTLGDEPGPQPTARKRSRRAR